MEPALVLAMGAAEPRQVAVPEAGSPFRGVPCFSHKLAILTTLVAMCACSSAAVPPAPTPLTTQGPNIRRVVDVSLSLPSPPGGPGPQATPMGLAFRSPTDRVLLSNDRAEEGASGSVAIQLTRDGGRSWLTTWAHQGAAATVLTTCPRPASICGCSSTPPGLPSSPG
jgi:hypothetical protein